MIHRSINEVCEMVGGCGFTGNCGDAYIRGVSTDTRNMSGGSLFIPIRGDKFNGHDYVRDAFKGGAAAALWCNDEPDAPAQYPLIYVDDTLEAIQKLAHAYRRQLYTKVIAITGSNGKTSTKDILAALLSSMYKTQKTKGNLNNHLGVPLTLLELEEDTEMAVVEMGMSGLGEIGFLSTLANPDAALITSVSEVHLGNLHTREAICEAKLEILQGLKSDGYFVYNGDNPLFLECLEATTLPAHHTCFGESLKYSLHPTSFRMNEEGVIFTVSDPRCPELVVPMLGRHQMMNAIGATAIALYFGVPYEILNEAFRHIKVSGMRCELIKSGSLTIINDAYKSNPTSLRAALNMFYALAPSKRKIAVLGEMVELGDESAVLHREIGSELDPARIDMLFTIGSMAQLIAQEAAKRFPQSRIVECRNNADLIERLKLSITDDCMVLVKGSRKLGLEEVVETLRVEATRYA